MPERSPDFLREAGTDQRANPSLILVATDLSDLDRLMPFALEQAAEAGARLILLHVLATGAVVATGAIGMPSYDPAGAHEFATNTLEPWRLLAVRRGIGCDALVRQGHPAHQIGTVIRQFRADLVLLGTRSRSRLGKLLVGSVAEHVLRSVNLPVITVGPEAHVAESAASGSGRLILHATTLKEGFRASAELACRLAASQSARLLLVHVLPPLSEGARTEGAGTERARTEGFSGNAGQSGEAAGPDSTALHELNRLAGKLAKDWELRWPAILTHVVHGNPAIEILAKAAETRAKLIVLGATDRSAFANLTRDRTIYRVLAHARCPVLTLRESQVVRATGESRSTVIHVKGQGPTRDF